VALSTTAITTAATQGIALLNRLPTIAAFSPSHER
jgi:hypothetical protein